MNSLVGRKLRVSAALVVAAYRDGQEATESEFHGQHDPDFVYRIGEVAVPDSYNPDIRVECTHGIHCFIT